MLNLFPLERLDFTITLFRLRFAGDRPEVNGEKAVRRHFVEYAAAMKSAPGKDGLMRFSMQAARYVAAENDPLVAMHLGMQYTLAIRNLDNAIRSFEITE